jgi:hypothetical protein
VVVKKLAEILYKGWYVLATFAGLSLLQNAALAADAREACVAHSFHTYLTMRGGLMQRADFGTAHDITALRRLEEAYCHEAALCRLGLKPGDDIPAHQTALHGALFGACLIAEDKESNQ